ncbi:monothiol glutaredoxin grx5 [Komagataella kurtzmanii]|nr:monothiol glutaredoxin grx5 [Komagataella kurtzmanii]
MFRTTVNRIPLRSTFSQSILRRQTALRFLSSETKNAIESAVNSAKVVLFMKGTPQQPQCGFSRATIQMLGQQGVDPEKFAAYNVLEDQELREGIKEYSQWPTIPQLYVDKEFVGGCDIVMSMAQSGELTELLEKHDALIPEEPYDEAEPEKAADAEVKPRSRD